MSERVVGPPEFEAKELFNEYIDTSPFFEYFFEDASPPDGITKEDYLKELEKCFFELLKEYYSNLYNREIKA